MEREKERKVCWSEREREKEREGARSLITLDIIVRTQWILLRINYAINKIVKYWLKDEYELKVLTQNGDFPFFSILCLPGSVPICLVVSQKHRKEGLF